MDAGTIFLTVLAATLLLVVAAYHPARLGEVFANVKAQGGNILLRVPLALLMASFVGRLIPPEVIASIIGGESGWRGIVISSLLGGLIPGGPMVSFPLAIVIWQMGAGEPQMVAFLAAWSIFALHRVIAFEWPLLGGRFVLVRFASTWMLPPLAGLLAYLLLLAR